MRVPAADRGRAVRHCGRGIRACVGRRRAVQLCAAAGPGEQQPVDGCAFQARRRPVTNAEFLAFVLKHPRVATRPCRGSLRRRRVPGALEECDSARTGCAPAAAGDARQLVCGQGVLRSRAVNGCRPGTSGNTPPLPNETQADARNDAVWREKVLDWYAEPTPAALPDVGARPRTITASMICTDSSGNGCSTSTRCS